MRSILILILLSPLFSFAQLSKKDSLWLPFADFIGEWKGTGEGADGKATYERSYKLILNKNYIEVKNRTAYAPNEKNKNGYAHEDIGYISYDKSRKTFIFRQFHIEGYINQYKMESRSADNRTFTFVSEAIENIPAGWRAKEVLTINDTGLEEEFYLAEPGKDFARYTNAKLSKQ